MVSRKSTRWMSIDRLLLIAYGCAWPAFLLLLTRRSESSHWWGLWSFRMFCLLAFYGTFLVAGGVFVYRVRRPGSRGRLLLQLLVQRCRVDGRYTMVCGLGPVALFLAVIIYAGLIGVVLTPLLVFCLFQSLGVVLIWETILVCGDRPARVQKKWVGKAALAAMATLLTLCGVEIVAAVTGLGAYIDWDLNPRNLDSRMNCDEFDVLVQTNSQGLREPDYVEPRHAGTYRILVVGDSMTFGWGVEYEESYAQVAERALRGQLDRPVEIVNLGKAGMSPVDYLRTIQRCAGQLEPDMIVVGFLVGNDCPVESPARTYSETELQAQLRVYRNAARGRSLAARSVFLRLAYWGMYRRLAGMGSVEGAGRRGPIYGEPNPLDPRALDREITGQFEAGPRHQRLRKFTEAGWIKKGLDWDINPWLIRSMLLDRHGARSALGLDRADLQALECEWKLCEGLLVEMNKAAEEMNAVLVVLALPSAYQVSEDAVAFLDQLGCDTTPDMITSRVVNDWLVTTCKRRGLPCIDALPALRAKGGQAPLFYPRDAHLTAEGHRLVGSLLADGVAPTIPLVRPLTAAKPVTSKTK